MSSAEESQKPYRETAAENIRELAQINETNLPTILTTSATALSQLTYRPISTSQDTHDSPHLRETNFKTSTAALVKLVEATRNALTSHVDKLADLGVIPTEAPKPLTTQQQEQGMKEEAVVTNGGLGEFDVGMLNARARVGREEEDVLGRVERLLTDLAEEHQEKKGDKDMVDG